MKQNKKTIKKIKKSQNRFTEQEFKFKSKNIEN